MSHRRPFHLVSAAEATFVQVRSGSNEAITVAARSVPEPKSFAYTHQMVTRNERTPLTHKPRASDQGKARKETPVEAVIPCSADSLRALCYEQLEVIAEEWTRSFARLSSVTAAAANFGPMGFRPRRR